MRHCERSEAIQVCTRGLDGLLPWQGLLAMTGETRERCRWTCWSASRQSSGEAQDLAGVHDVFWIERPLDRAHDVQLGPGPAVREFVDLLHADAMFRRDRTSHGGDEIVHGPRDRSGILAECLLVHALR